MIKETQMSDIEKDLLDEQEVDVSEEATPDMSYDKKGAEGDSIAAKKKAEDATKKAPARKGDNQKQDAPNKATELQKAVPQSKTGIVSDMYHHLNDMSRDELEVAYKQLMGIEDEVVEEEAQHEVPDIETEADFSEDLDALVAEEATLSDEFKAKTAVIFESALKTKLAEEIVRIESAYEEKLEAELISQREEFVEKVDSYLNYVVEQWMEENKIAIHQGLRTEIAEKFMNNLKDMFVESYVEVPESKIDLVDDLADQVEELEEQLFKTTTDAIKLSEEVTQLKRSAIIREATADLAETQAEKLASLCGDLDFDDEDTFATKVATVKESYFSRTTTTEDVTEASDDPEAYVAEESVAPTMERYLTAMRRTNQ
jgi:hypothetical protein